MEYKYLRVHVSATQIAINDLAKEGWMIHTFSRNLNADLVDVLLQRPRDTPSITCPCGRR